MLERAIYPSLNGCGINVSILGKVILGMFLAAGSAGMGEYKFGADSKVVQVFWSNSLHWIWKTSKHMQLLGIFSTIVIPEKTRNHFFKISISTFLVGASPLTLPRIALFLVDIYPNAPLLTVNPRFTHGKNAQISCNLYLQNFSYIFLMYHNQ